MAEPVFGPTEIRFPEGLVGLPQLVRHELRLIPDTELFELTSLDDPAMGFIAAKADGVRPGMTEALRQKQLISPDETLLVLLAVHGEPAAVTANLAGPVAIHPEQATARQLVLEDPDYPLREPVAELH